MASKVCKNETKNVIWPVSSQRFGIRPSVGVGEKPAAFEPEAIAEEMGSIEGLAWYGGLSWFIWG